PDPSHLHIVTDIKGANDARWITRNDLGRRDVAYHNAACADDAAVADGHARKNDRASPDPLIVSDADRASIFQAGSPYIRLKRMRRGVQLYRRTHLQIISDLDRRAVEKHAVEVDEGVPSELNVVAIITEEDRPDDCAVPDRTTEP